MTSAKILVHGGFINDVESDEGCMVAAKAGKSVLDKGGSALDAVVDAIVVMENDERFNAGTGSYLKLNGEIEMDASIMTSEGLCGSVAGIKNVKNPILVARKVMENTPHVLLSGEGATQFARKCGFPLYNPITKRISRISREYKRKLVVEKQPKYAWILKNYPELLHGTVGAVARDSDGRFAGAVSTGGTYIMLPGRVGDSAIIGAGIYVGSKGAIVATGVGEEIIRRVFSRGIYDNLASGKKIVDACNEKVLDFPDEVKKYLGAIVVTADDSAIVMQAPIAHAII